LSNSPLPVDSEPQEVPGFFDPRHSKRYAYGKINEFATAALEWHGWEHTYWRLAGLSLVAVILVFCITTPLSLLAQTIYGVGVFATALYLRRYTGKLFTLMMIMFSVNASGRYLYWRFTETLSLDTWLNAFFALLLVMSEVYALSILFMGYAQTIWPLRRNPEPMPDDIALWPSVDIFIPTYNESIKVVGSTVLAAISMDWPREKLNVYLLDDGRREEFREFAASVGVNYITRDNNRHAKAGNINAALPKTNGEFIAIFDCDHVPARSFLQITMGWFLRDAKLSMVQTPHHFLSPDPFERNLNTFRRVPNEGELFYGLIQDGNDLWNATFFCGSCAVLRRTMLLEIGGVAVETVTEDAHTALKLHRQGYTTAYISIPQAGGLATENLSSHVGQRIRWARGMAQIFRIDNPFLGKGLTFMQRLCYANAMMHFFYGLPRIVFLLAPLSYMFFEAHIISASALAIAAYSLPHLAHANSTNSRMQGMFRRSFWAEVYESTLAWYILRPTTVALFNPKAGSFNVTSKGDGLVENEFLDWKISTPYLIMLGLNIVGFLVGLVRLFWWNTNETDTVVLNLIWTLYNLVLLGATMAVATESRQVRKDHRINFDQKVMLKLLGGACISCRTKDYSQGGLGLIMPAPGMVPVGSEVRVSLFLSGQEYVFPADAVFIKGAEVALQFKELTPQQRVDFVQCTLARADAWIQEPSDEREMDHPMKGLKEIFFHGVQGFKRLGHYLLLFGGTTYSEQMANNKVSRFWSKHKQKAAEKKHSARAIFGKISSVNATGWIKKLGIAARRS